MWTLLNFFLLRFAEIILSLGSIGSPHILQVSGIGPSKLLNENNVKIIKENNYVGENLHDHLMLRPVYTVQDVETLNELYHSTYKKIKMLMPDINIKDNQTIDIRIVCPISGW